MAQENTPAGWQEVTDPKILAQLNSPQQATPQSAPPSNWQEVTDPAILAQLNGTAAPQSLGSRYLNFVKQNAIDDFSPFYNTLMGAGDAWRNTYAAGLNALPGVDNIPALKQALAPVQNGQGTAYGLGKIAGNIGGFLAGGEVLDSMRAAAEGIPTVGALAKYLGGQTWAPTVARNAIGGGIYGGLATNQDRTDNSIIGAGANALASALPFGLGKIGQAAQYFMPQKYSNKILQNLSGGQTLQDATKSVLGAVKNSYEQQTEDSDELYNAVHNSVPDSSIYAKIGKANSQYLNLPENVTNQYTNDIEELHNNFLSNPTFDNAHDLQSQIGSRLRQLQSSRQAPDRATANEISALSKARSALVGKDDEGNITGDIGAFLNSQSPELNQAYKVASDNFLDNVAPYRSNPSIYSIASGAKTNVTPSSLANIFKAPDENMQKIISDLPPGTMDKVLYTQLGKDTPSNNPFAFIKAYNRLQEQGLGNYISPELESQINSLQNRIKARSTLQSAVGALLGAVGGSHHGAAGTVGMGLAGGAFASPVMNYLSRRLPLEQIGNAIGRAASAAYPALKNTILAKYLNNSGVQQ